MKRLLLALSLLGCAEVENTTQSVICGDRLLRRASIAEQPACVVWIVTEGDVWLSYDANAECDGRARECLVEGPGQNVYAYVTTFGESGRYHPEILDPNPDGTCPNPCE